MKITDGNLGTITGGANDVLLELCNKYRIYDEIKLWKTMDIMDKMKLVMAERKEGGTPTRSLF